MYVVGSPRSGSTALAIHKALEANIPFRGELSPLYVLQGDEPRLNFKRTFHETGVQPDYTLAEYLMHWENINSPSSMYLLTPSNSSPPVWNNACAYITRKNFRTALISVANYVIKNNPLDQERDPRYIRQNIIVNATGTCLMLKYCAEHQKEITWYEDTFDRQTDYVFYENYQFKQDLDDAIEKVVQEMRPELLNQSIIV